MKGFDWPIASHTDRVVFTVHRASYDVLSEGGGGGGVTRVSEWIRMPPSR